jgi:hypothetical protein
LLTFLQTPGDWVGALQRDFATMQATTAQGVGSLTVSDVHQVQVPGAEAALAFTAHIAPPAAKRSEPALDSADLLTALSDGTEVHVLCSGPTGTLPAHLAEGVDSITLR